VTDRIDAARGGLTSPAAAAVAGILFSVLLMLSMTLIYLAVPGGPSGSAPAAQIRLDLVEASLALLPFAGIAFLWFIGVVRQRLGDREDQLFSTVFLGSGLLFLAMLFTSAAVAGGTLRAFEQAPPDSSGSMYTYGRAVTYVIMNVYAMRMAGVFMISTATLALRTGILPRWMSYLGLALALALLLLSFRYVAWVNLLFPAWTLLISVYVLAESLRRPTRP
jgi:hypothetical protein